MASRIIAQLIVTGAGMLLRAGSQAWRQAIISEHPNGARVVACSFQGWRRHRVERLMPAAGGGLCFADGQKAGLGEAAAAATGRKAMSLQEAQLILGVAPTASLEEVTQRWQHLLEINEKHGMALLPAPCVVAGAPAGEVAGRGDAVVTGADEAVVGRSGCRVAVL
eukprot:scaffold2727_cov385-Prasinococcus_capsulatus_cf.AAC.5